MRIEKPITPGPLTETETLSKDSNFIVVLLVIFVCEIAKNSQLKLWPVHPAHPLNIPSPRPGNNGLIAGLIEV